MARAKKNNDTTDTRTKKAKFTWLNNVRYGRALSLDFFRRNAWLLIVIIIAVISLIGLRYKTKTKMSTIKTLNAELELAKSEKIRQKAAYMTLIRESEMKRLAAEKGLGLEFREEPPFEIDINDAKTSSDHADNNGAVPSDKTPSEKTSDNTTPNESRP